MVPANFGRRLQDADYVYMCVSLAFIYAHNTHNCNMLLCSTTYVAVG